MQSQVRFNRVPEKVPVKVWEALVQSQVRFNRSFRRRFGADPGQVQQGSGEGSGEGLGGFGAKMCKAKSGSTGFGEGCGKGGFGNLWCGAGSGSIGSAGGADCFGFAARFRKICKNKTSQLLGLPPKLILPIEPHFVRKGSPETRNRNFTSVFGDRTSMNLISCESVRRTTC